METACGYLDDKVMWVSTDEKRMINRLLKIADEHRDEVEILAIPEENDGCLYLKCPADWLKITPPRHLNLTDDQRVARLARLGKLPQKTSTESMKFDEE